MNTVMRYCATSAWPGCLALLLFLVVPAASAQHVPGTVPGGAAASSLGKGAALSGISSLTPTVTETGFISLSIDGCGSSSSSCTTDVEKPAGATVRGAYITSSTNSGFVIPDNAITINGAGVAWDATGSAAAGPSFPNYFRTFFADVTDIVKPIVDAAAAGTVSLTISEGGSSSGIDGSGIVVIFDDPSQTTQSTAVLAFGAQQTTGDSFNIALAEPFADATQDITLSLAIGFSNQSGGQFSIVDVNGDRMTSSAGDADDGALANGALYTIGGLGDDPANPADPNSTTFDDDELYTLDPFIDEGDTGVTVFSRNPSNDDVIHLATFLIKGTAAIIGEGILLTPLSATNPVNTSHTVTASVQDDNGDPVVGRTVNFEVLSGPNAGLTGSGVTDGNGDATFTFSSATAGTDVVVARFVNSQSVMVTSNQATKTWTDDGDPACTDPATAPSYAGGYVLNAAGTRAFVKVRAPQGGSSFEFYNTSNLAVGDPESDTESGTLLTGMTRVGDTFSFSAGSEPTEAFFPISLIDPSVTHISFFLKITDTCGRTVDVDPSFAVTGVEATALEGFALGTARPNPMASEATIRFSLDRASAVRLSLYDVLGREVARLVDETREAGRHEASFEASSLPAGVYVYRLEADGRALTGSLTVAR